MDDSSEVVRSDGARAASVRSVELVTRQVDRFRRRLTVQALMQRLALVCVCAAVFPLLVVIADHAWPHGLPRWALTGAVLLWAGALAVAVAVASAASLASTVNPLFAARLLERCHDIRFNSLVNALLLGRDVHQAYAFPAAARQAARDVRTHPDESWPRGQAWSTPLAVGALVLAAWLIYGLATPKAVGPSLGRFFGLPLAAPTATRLELIHPRADEAVHVGDELRIEVAVRGRAVDEVGFDILSLNGANGEPVARHSLSRAATGPADRWTLVLAPHEVTRDIAYRCTAGDAVLRGVIPVQPQPEIEAMEVELEPPAYTGWPVETVSGPEFDALAGTRATLHLQANTEVRDPVFVLLGERETRTRMTVDEADASRFHLSLVLVQSGDYRVEFGDRWGYAFRDPPVHHITVRADASPTIEITDPSKESQPDDVVDIRRQAVLVAAAADDVRVAGIAFVRADGGPEARMDVPLVEAADGRQARVQIDTASLGMRPGTSEKVWFEARDNRAQLDGWPSPQTGKSRVLTLVCPPETPQAGKKPDAGAKPSDKGKPERTGGKEEPSPSGEDGATDGTPQSGSQTDDQNEGSGAGSEQPSSQPADGQTGSGEGGQQGQSGSEAGGEASGQGAGDDAAGELERFVRQHGEMAREVDRQLGGGEKAESGQAGDGDGKSSQGNSSSEAGGSDQSSGQDAGKSSGDSKSGDASKNGESPAPGQDSSGDQSPDDSSSGQSQDASKSQTEAGAAGQTPGGGATGSGDSPTSQAAKPQGQPDDKPAEKPSPPPDGVASLESEGLTETLDLLKMLERGENINEDMLVERGWPAERAGAFVKALKRVYEVARKAGRLDALQRVRFDAKLGDESVQAGSGLAGEVGTTVDAGHAGEDAVRKIVPPAEQHVPAHLRALLDAYYRSLAGQGRAGERGAPEPNQNRRP